MKLILRLAAYTFGVTLAASTAVAATTSDRLASVRIIAFNDFHGHLEPGGNAVQVPDPTQPSKTVPLRSGGVAFLAALIRQLRAEQPDSVVVSSGDLIGASPLVSGLFLDEPTIEVMNEIGVDLNAVGNHEFDRGTRELLRIADGGCRAEPASDHVSCASATHAYSGASFPFLSANVHDRDGRALFPSTLVRTVNGVRVGFVGAVTRSTPGIVHPDRVAGLRFSSEAKAINEAAAHLRAQGVQAIVAVIHEGGDADGGFNACGNPRGAIFAIEHELDPSIDIVLSAHTHRGYRCLVGSRLVLQGASFGRLVSVVDLAIDRASGDVVRAETKAYNLPVPNGLSTDERLRAAFPPLAPDPAVAAIVEHYQALAAPLAGRPVGQLAERFDRAPSAGGDHALGRLIADAQLAATREHGASVAFTNPGGIRAELRPHGEPGAVNYGDLYMVQPFGNALVTLTLTGAQLKTLLEQQWSSRDGQRARILQPSSGFAYAWDASRPVGARVVADSMRLDGRAVDADSTYRVTVNDFLASGGDGFRILREGRDVVGGPLDVEALMSYIRRASDGQPLRPDRSARITRRG
jgi:5'-nucleotidase